MMVDPRFIEADRTIADLRSQLEAAREDCKDLDSIATQVSNEAMDLRQQLEAVQREQDEWHEKYQRWVDIGDETWAGWKQKYDAERTKREEAERERDAWKEAAQLRNRWIEASHQVAEEAYEARYWAERRLGEALSYAQHRPTCYSRQFDKAPCNCGLRIVLASQTEAPHDTLLSGCRHDEGYCAQMEER